jgi:hypothetical protein
MGAVRADDILGVGESCGKESTKNGENQESNICAVSDGLVFGFVDVLAERNLASVSLIHANLGVLPNFQ